ncbi:MAG: hypothetical protein HN742_41650 [Lentisphaerae bacterium]|jgi:hypothetical protein|nr:hypothetical protein [Lentisphaerota bacterium]MBT5611720.1 hypothetical protein [Lentisphaerota bacterium]MBT7060440.1 hypothetical protein [Lentisphaerota bacterium]MBT7848443.1 hypothetical protein [Lentisphaerota bacterium]
MRRCALSGFCFVSLMCSAWILRADEAARTGAKKLIATGWDKVDQTRLKQHIGEMETCPFSGVMMSVVGQTDDGKACHLRSAHTAKPWKRAWFAAALEDLQSVEFRRLTDNFVSIGANPGNVDWFDDEGWANITEHWAIAAWLAREAGFRGFLFDPEPYRKPYAQFRYGAQDGRNEHSFDEYVVKARERGSQVMAAVVREFPEITVYCYFMNSVNAHAATAAQPKHVLESGGYGLFPSFIDGWLDAASPSATFVDGCESAYRYNSELQFLRSALTIKGACQRLVAPENRAKYRAQVQVSYGIYLDAHWNPPDTKWATWMIDCGDRKPVEQLMVNVRNAIQCCDQYVWLYGEKFRWWPTPNQRVFKQYWPEALPGCDVALQLACNPTGYARRMLAEAEGSESLPNLARNGDFQSAAAPNNSGQQADWREGGAPAGWSCWQLKADEGTFTWDKDLGAAKASAISESGCFIQTYDVAEGECYAIRARVKTSGRTRTWLRVRWQTAEGRWTQQSLDVVVGPETPGTDSWAQLLAAPTVPEGAGKLVVLLGMGSQESPEDAVWFDDVQVHLLTPADLLKRDPVRCDLEQ